MVPSVTADEVWFGWSQRKVPEKGIQNADFDGSDRFKSGFRSKKRPNPFADHLSGANPEDAVYYDDVFFDEAGDDYKDQPNLVKNILA